MRATGETEILRGLCNKLPNSLHTTAYTRLIHLSTFLMDSDAKMRRGREKKCLLPPSRKETDYIQCKKMYVLSNQS